MKYFYFFTEKEQIAGLQNRFYSSMFNSAIEFKESNIYNCKVISLKKIVQKFVKNK